MTRLLETAARLHEAALDPARWPEVMSAAQLQLSLDRASGELSAEEAAWMDSIIESATRVCAEAARLELARAMAGSAFEVLPIGLALCDGRGHLVRANPEAERLVRTLTSVADLAREAISRENGTPLVARLARHGGRAVEAVAVTVSRTSETFRFSEARAVVFLLDPERHAVDERLLATVFHLTRAEVRFAVRLVRGETVQEIARALGIKATTARTHLARLFAKTGTSRQAELVRLLAITSFGAPPQRDTDDRR